MDWCTKDSVKRNMDGDGGSSKRQMGVCSSCATRHIEERTEVLPRVVQIGVQRDVCRGAQRDVKRVCMYGQLP